MILSGSRGGILCLVFEICVLALLVRGRKSEERPNLAVVGIVATAAVALIVWVGAEEAITLRTSEVLSKQEMSIQIGAFRCSRGAAGVFPESPLQRVRFRNNRRRSTRVMRLYTLVLSSSTFMMIILSCSLIPGFLGGIYAGWLFFGCSFESQQQF